MNNKKSIIIWILFATLIFNEGCFISKESRKLYSTIKANDSLYFDMTEIDVASWLSYYTWILQHEGYNAAQKALPDSNVVEPEVWKYIKRKSEKKFNLLGRYTWQEVGYFCEKCSDFIDYEKWLNLTKPESCPFLYFPITGVSYEQVVNFCKWRTKVLGENNVLYRLPTPEEWTDFALKGLSDTNRKNRLKDSLLEKECPNYNYKFSKPCSLYKFLTSKQNGPFRYPPELTGAADVFGNVSEMTSIKGIAKGGNYMLYANQCHPDSVQHYSKPEKWLGFRCVAVKNSNNVSVNNTSQNTNSLNTDTIFNFFKWDKRFSEFSDKRDGKTYYSVKIGEQIWMAQNLAYKPTEGKYFSYKNDNKNISKLGYLYTWETSQNVCPSGWHLPKKEEFEMLLQNVGGSDTLAYKRLIPSGSSGFSILSSGFGGGVIFTPPEQGTGFWSSSKSGKRRVIALVHGRFKPKTLITDEFSTSIGLYVRCIQDK